MTAIGPGVGVPGGGPLGRGRTTEAAALHRVTFLSEMTFAIDPVTFVGAGVVANLKAAIVLAAILGAGLTIAEHRAAAALARREAAALVVALPGTRRAAVLVAAHRTNSVVFLVFSPPVGHGWISRC